MSRAVVWSIYAASGYFLAVLPLSCGGRRRATEVGGTEQQTVGSSATCDVANSCQCDIPLVRTSTVQRLGVHALRHSASRPSITITRSLLTPSAVLSSD